jgi:VCBS repeat-containing protein
MTPTGWRPDQHYIGHALPMGPLSSRRWYGLTTTDANYCNDGSPTDDFTYTLNPGGSTATVAVTVTCVDDPPTAVDDTATVLEDAAATNIDVLANDTDIDGGPAFTIASVTQPANGTVVITGGGTGLTYQPNANYCNGGSPTDNFTYTLTPGGSTATVAVTVTCVNDAPSFTKGADQTVDEDAGAQTVNGWATAISVGPNESGQTVSFLVSNNNNGLFSAQPAVSPAGALTYTPAANQNGSATVSVQTTDNGGTANGGVDTSTAQTFSITVSAVNDPPVAQTKTAGSQANMKIVGVNPGLLTGVTDADSGVNSCAPTFTVASITSNTGGTVSNVSLGAGTFDFDPTPGFTGTAVVNYTVQDTGCPGTATSASAAINITVSGPVIWFVDPAAGVNGNGGLSSPFNNLASAAAVDASGHRIFVYSGTATSGIALNSDEWLIGQGVTGTTFDALFSITPPTGTIARPGINGTRPVMQGNVALATSDAVSGLNIQPASGTAGLTASGATNLTVNEVSVSATNATAVGLTNSDGTFSFTRIDANGGSNGIIWNNASPATGSFTVNGDGANTTVGGNGSGGTITNMTGSDGAIAGTGVYLNNARNFTLRRMTINGTNQNYGIKGFLVNGFTLEYSTVSGTNGTSPSLPAPEN